MSSTYEIWDILNISKNFRIFLKIFEFWDFYNISMYKIMFEIFF